jgi:transcription antitermination protein NusB
MESGEGSAGKQRRGSRRENRVICLQFLYFWETKMDQPLDDLLRTFFDGLEKDRSLFGFAEALIFGTIENVRSIDEKIQACADNWTLDRISKVDLAILRVAAYELFYREDIPPIVTINEAIELSKLFSDRESKRFVNGVLDKMKESLGRPLRSGAVLEKVENV